MKRILLCAAICAFMAMWHFITADAASPVLTHAGGAPVPNPGVTGRTYAVCKSGDFLFSADHKEGVNVYNISALSSPVHVKSLRTTELGMDIDMYPVARVVANGDYLFVVFTVTSTADNCIKMYDISDPTAPLHLGNARARSPRPVVSDGLLYVADLYEGLLIYDYNSINPTTNELELVSYVKNTDNTVLGYSVNMCIQGDYIYLANHEGYIHIFDLSNKNMPKKRGSVRITQPSGAGHVFSGISVSGNYIYVTTTASNTTNRVQIIDATDVDDLKLDSFFSNGNVRFGGVYANGDYIYVSELEGLRIMLMDVSDPTEAPRIVCTIAQEDSFGAKIDLLEDEYIFTSQNIQGFNIYSITRYASGTLSVTSDGQEVNKLAANTIDMGMSVTNYSAGPLTLYPIMALYQGNELAEISADYQNIPPGRTAIVSASMTVSSVANRRLKAMVWDSPDRMNLISVEWSGDNAAEAVSVGRELLP